MMSQSPQFSELDHLLSFFNKNPHRKVSSADLSSFLNTLGEDISCAEAETIINSIDAASDGVLDLDQVVARPVEPDAERDLREAFRMYENDGEGCITSASLKRMLSRLGMSREMDQCQAMICRFDGNGDGVLCFEEFKVMMMMP